MDLYETFEVKAPIQEVWDFTQDPNPVGPRIPGCEEVSVAAKQSQKSRIKIAAGSIQN